MSEIINPEEIKKTQSTLSKYIKEPPLTEKLLRKPPFRFLHDLIKSVIKETGFLSDVFTAEDLNLDNIKNKEGKIAFLKKLIAATKDATGYPLNVKPNKIVAGLEVPKTLELLQAVGKGITLKLNGTLNQKGTIENKKITKEKVSAVKDVGSLKKVKINKDDTHDESNVKKKGKSHGREIGSSEKKKKEKVEKEKSMKKEDLDKMKEDEQDLKIKKEIRLENEQVDELSIKPKNEINGINGLEVDTSKEQADGAVLEDSNENIGKKQFEVAIKENGIPASSEENNQIVEDGKNDETKKKIESSSRGERRHSSRRQSSRTRPSAKVAGAKEENDKEKQDVTSSNTKRLHKEGKETSIPLLGAVEAAPISTSRIERPTTARKAPPSARAPGVPKAKDRGEIKLPEPNSTEAEVKPVVVIMEDHALEEDKENLVTVEAQPLAIENDFQDKKLVGELENELIGENEGALVSQILETKKELEEKKQQWANANQRTVEIEWEGGKKQKRDIWLKEINKLRESIQELTRTTNPLGKLFDFLQEDVDSMQRELKSWTNVTQQFKEQLLQEQKLTEITLDKYKKQLAEIDSLIEQEQEAVRNIKGNLIANDRRIHNLLTRANLPNE